jgi:hypothetical protein
MWHICEANKTCIGEIILKRAQKLVMDVLTSLNWLSIGSVYLCDRTVRFHKNRILVKGSVSTAK